MDPVVTGENGKAVPLSSIVPSTIPSLYYTNKLAMVLAENNTTNFSIAAYEASAYSTIHWK
jgi:hypothetical protein